MATELDRLMTEVNVTDKQMEFCEEYLRTLNASQAYRKVYAVGDTMKDWQVWHQARKKLNDKGVRQYINARRADARRELVIDTTRVLSELSALAFTDITDVVEVKGNKVVVNDLDDLTPEQRKSIKKITYKERENKYGTNTELIVEMHDKQRAIDTLCKHLGIIESAKNMTQINNTQNVINVKPEDLSTEQLKALVDAEADKPES